MQDLAYNIYYKGRLKYLTSKLLDSAGFLLHAYSTRQGGISKEPYNSLNLGLSGQDDKQNVIQNRKLFCKATGIEPYQIFCVNQVHGNEVLLVDDPVLEAWRKKREAMPPEKESVRADALLTNLPGVALAILTADCLPIIIADPERKAIAIVHAGWRGTLQGVTQQALFKLGECFGGRPGEWLISLGPCIGACCYTIGQEVVDLFAENFSDWRNYIICDKTGQYRLNLREANKSQLLKFGINPKNIDQVGECTACHTEDFFSYRKAHPATGRMMSLVMLKPE
jgi:YfiH family protein